MNIEMPPIAYTLGEPAGIGVDIIILLAQTKVLKEVVCIGDRRCLSYRAKQLGVPLNLVDSQASCEQLGTLRVLHQPFDKPDVCSEMHADNVPAILTMLNTAIDGCLSGQFRAMVTGPLNKGIINQVTQAKDKVSFLGHTEYLAQRVMLKNGRTPLVTPVMMLADEQLRVALMTTHIPLRKVPDTINAEGIERICAIVHDDLKNKFAIEKPRLVLCGLNPHAGENGHLGQEEIDVIQPAIKSLKKNGINIIGPLPADTAFTQKIRANADVIIAMYHDQGLAVIKALSFGRSANITLGLPIVRTSVDHGTALDLAGTGKANMGGLKTAFDFADQMSQR